MNSGLQDMQYANLVGSISQKLTNDQKTAVTHILLFMPDLRYLSSKPQNFIKSTEINSQSLEDTQVEYTSHKYTFEEKKNFKEIQFGMGCGPVDWWGGSSQNRNSKINGLSFFISFYLSDRYWDFWKKKQLLGTSWMGWGPFEWVGGQLTGPPRIKIRK